MALLTPAFLQSLTIIVREGFEVVLLLGAMLAVLRKVEAAGRASALWWGAVLALVASLATAVLLERLSRSVGEVEVLEGLTMLLAALVLLAVGHWLLARAEAARWHAYLRRRVRQAAGKRSLVALGSVAFVAVYREGVETVLFYRALLAGEGSDLAAAAGGFLAGLALLAIALYAVYRFGARVPLRPFFTITSVLLLLLAFTFTGKGLHELQEAGLIGATRLSAFRFPALGIYAILETLVAQAAILLAIFAPLVYRWTRAQASPLAVEERPGETLTDAA